jgi:microcystin-dependent protein
MSTVIAKQVGLATPPGVIFAFAGATAPDGWLICEGQNISRTTFAELFGVIGTTWGQGDGSTTFNIPNLAGKFLRGVDNGFGQDPDSGSRTANATGGNTGDNVGTHQLDEFKSHTHDILGNNDVSDNSRPTLTGPAEPWTEATQPTGGNETRPKNVYVNYIIKT